MCIRDSGSTAVGSIVTGLLVTHVGMRNALLVNGVLAVATQSWLVFSIWREGATAGAAPDLAS